MLPAEPEVLCRVATYVEHSREVLPALFISVQSMKAGIRYV
jgi:hypothetical protein